MNAVSQPPRTYKAFPGWLCISGTRVRRYIRDSYGKLVLTDEAEIEGPVSLNQIESFREKPNRE